MKLCIITCYNQPDYIRAKTLRAAAYDVSAKEVLVVKNNNIGLMRYLEVFMRVVNIRIREKPDAYLLTFRGYEMLLPMRILTVGKPLLYDEFINPIEWVVKEKRKVEGKQGSRFYRWSTSLASIFIIAIVSSPFFKWGYRQLIRSVDVVLTDTESHAAISKQLTGGLSAHPFVAIPVGTDETTFNIDNEDKAKNDKFIVFYYGNMLPLHGLNHVINAAIKLKNESVKFVLIGGNANVARDVKNAQNRGASIEYKAWIEFDQLPKLMRKADLCLAGPFGNTFQAQYVITGKAFQYLAMGRPTVIGRNEESGVFTDKENALIVPQGSTDAIVKAIEWGMTHREELAAIGRNGRTLYDERYSLPRICEQLETALAFVHLPLKSPANTEDE